MVGPYRSRPPRIGPEVACWCGRLPTVWINPGSWNAECIGCLRWRMGGHGRNWTQQYVESIEADPKVYRLVTAQLILLEAAQQQSIPDIKEYQPTLFEFFKQMLL